MVANQQAAPARPLGRAVPEVERLAVRMVTDNVVIQFVPTESRKGITIERRSAGSLVPDAPPRASLSGEWGLSMHAESRRGNEVRNVLIDFGYTPEVLLNNMTLLGVDPATFDALVLSHGHYDHYGGMVGFLSVHKGALKRKLPFFIGGEDCFCWRKTPTGNFGAIDRRAIADSGLLLMMAEGPALVADQWRQFWWPASGCIFWTWSWGSSTAAGTASSAARRLPRARRWVGSSTDRRSS
jgi:7,8-dihydropterin-6-yl-methyl-4-(beta-D-ribofuranosyl)aminobenzene 5'-phosphate synthase